MNRRSVELFVCVGGAARFGDAHGCSCGVLVPKLSEIVAVGVAGADPYNKQASKEVMAVAAAV